MNSSRQRLQARIDELQTRWDRLAQKLKVLAQQRDNETRVEEKMRMDTLIAETEKERQQVEEELGKLEAQLSNTLTASATLQAQPSVTTAATTPSTAPKLAGPVEVFYSYSHKDDDLRERLVTHLKLLQRQGVIKGWHDRLISAGTEWEGQIDHYLESAQIILLLISADFLASDYCYDKEMTRALARHEAGEARVIPIILKSVDWTGAPFSKLQALPRDGKAVTSWSNQDEAFTQIAQGIRQIALELAGKR
jgi:hypothetical protein